MKRSFLLSLAVAATVVTGSFSTAVAQAPGKAKMNIDQRLDRMKSQLALSDDQVTKLKAIFEEQKAAIDPIFQDQTLTPEQKREKAKPISQATRQKIADVLTPEQKAKMKELRAQKSDKKSD